MSCEDFKPETSKYTEEYQIIDVGQNLLEDLQEEQSRLSDDFPICSVLIDEAFDRFFSFGVLPGYESYADVLEQTPIKLTQKVIVPVKQYPKINFTAKILGPNGSSLTRLQDVTQCKITLKGRNSMLDIVEEEVLRQSGEAQFRHLNKDLHLEVSTEATPVECYTRIAYALAEIRKYLKPENDHDVLLLTDMESEAVCSIDVKSVKLEEDPFVDDQQTQTILNESHLPPFQLGKPQISLDKPLNISLADKLIKLLDETVLNPNFQNSEEKEEELSVSNNVGTSNNLVKTKARKKSTTTSNKTDTEKESLKERNPQTKNLGVTRKGKIFRKVTIKSSNSNNIETKSKTIRPIRKKYARITYNRMEKFPGIFYIKNIKTDKIVKRKILNKTALSHCLQRSCKENFDSEEEIEYKPYTIEQLQQNTTELVFEYTPRDIMLSLLENMKNYPVLWEYHEKPFNEKYIEAIKSLRQIMNDEWSLNIDSFKMHRSINRVLRFYRYLFPFENMEKFTDYFDKCVLFLPPNVMEVPHARCSQCFICFKEDAELRKHLKEEHRSLEWSNKCQHCIESFRHKDEYEFHKRLPHYVEIFTCVPCSERFNYCSEYNNHVEKHKQKQVEEPNKYECDECGKKFKTPYILRGHKYYHREKQFKCHLCPKAYFQNTNLMLHLKKHRNEYNFVCDECGKAFIAQKHLIAHMDKHTGFKVTCNICNLKVTRVNLLRHLKTIHVALEGTIEDTFRAKGVPISGRRPRRAVTISSTNDPVKRFSAQRFKHKLRAKRSSEKFPRQYVCKVCIINFDRLKFLKDHNKQYHADNLQKFQCKMCDSEITTKNNLKRHYIEKHKLHNYQAIAMLEWNEDINKLLAMTSEELEKMYEEI